YIITFMKLFSWFYKFFKTKLIEPEKSIEEILQTVQIGDIVRVEYKDPRLLGFNDGKSITLTRFNLDEINSRVIKGTIMMNRHEGYPLNDRVVEVAVPCQNNQTRRYLLLAHEIEKIEIL